MTLPSEITWGNGAARYAPLAEGSAKEEMPVQGIYAVRETTTASSEKAADEEDQASRQG
jgi:hypothetical protein